VKQNNITPSEQFKI